MAAIPRTAEAAECTADAVCRSTQRLRPVHDRGAGSVAAIRSAHTVAKTSKFLEWFGERHRLLARARIEDVDEFLAMKGAAGWNRKSVSVAAQALRAFFRYAETRGWCATGFAKGIQGPKIYQYEGLPEGPTWEGSATGSCDP